MANEVQIKVELTPKQSSLLSKLDLAQADIDGLVLTQVPDEVFIELLKNSNLPKLAKAKVIAIEHVGEANVDLDFGKREEKIAEFDPDQKYLTVPDAAERLEISTKSLYRWFNEQKLTKTKFMGKILVLESEVIEHEKNQEILRSITS